MLPGLLRFGSDVDSSFDQNEVLLYRWHCRESIAIFHPVNCDSLDWASWFFSHSCKSYGGRAFLFAFSSWKATGGAGLAILHNSQNCIRCQVTVSQISRYSKTTLKRSSSTVRRQISHLPVSCPGGGAFRYPVKLAVDFTP